MDHAFATKPALPPSALQGVPQPRQVGLILLALALGGFAIGTSEFVVMGLISEIARSLGVTEPQVGHVVSAYALGVWWVRPCWRSLAHACRGASCCCG